jgi:molybdate transport system substrate-binding protein
LASTAQAAEVTLIGSVAFKGPLEILVPQFTKATGHSVKLTLTSAAGAAKQVKDGAICDVVLITPAGLDDLQAAGVTSALTRQTIGTTSVSLAFKAGSPAPDIATPEKLRAVLLAANAISASDPANGGASSTYFLALSDRMGIGAEMRAKLIPTKSGDGAVPVAEGKAALGIGLSSELAATPGVLGEPLQDADPKSKIVLVVATTTKAPQPSAAAEFVHFLAMPDAVAEIRRAGFVTP